MANVDLWGTAIVLRQLKNQGIISEKEAKSILEKIAVDIGADLIISL